MNIVLQFDKRIKEKSAVWTDIINFYLKLEFKKIVGKIL